MSTENNPYSNRFARASTPTPSGTNLPPNGEARPKGGKQAPRYSSGRQAGLLFFTVVLLALLGLMTPLGIANPNELRTGKTILETPPPPVKPPITDTEPATEEETATSDPSDDRPANKVRQVKPIFQEVPALEKLISQRRGLPFKKHVRVGVTNSQELRKKILESYKEDLAQKELLKIKKALVKFGLIPADLNLEKFMIDLLTEQIAGFYDPIAKELYLVENTSSITGNLIDEEFQEYFGVSWSKLAVIHELTHALQDQNFDLLTLPLDDPDNDDLATAVKSVVEGEASFIMYDHLFKKIDRDLTLYPDISSLMAPAGTGRQAGAFSEPTTRNETLMARAPLYIQEGLLFPYAQGLNFIQKVKAAKGWDGVTNLYQDLPASTEQIMHPQKYLDEKRDYPIRITLPDLTDILEEKEWELLLKNVMGELNTKIIFKEFMPNRQTDRLASGWDGDQFAVWENKTTGQVLMLWLTTWDSLKDTREFTRAYLKLIKKKYPQAVELASDDWFKAKPGTTRKIWSTEEDFVLIEKKELDVLIIESAPVDRLIEIRDRVWSKTHKEELKKVNRVQPGPEKKR